MFRIGIAGPQGSGKTTLAHKLVNALEADYDKIAAPIYDLAKAIRAQDAGAVHFLLWREYDGFLLNAQHLFEMNRVPVVEKDRNLLQAIGTYGRSVKKDIWIDMLAARKRDARRLVVDDVRFFNEVGYFTHIIEISGEYNYSHESEIGGWKEYGQATYTIPSVQDPVFEDYVNFFCQEIRYKLIL